MTDTRRILLVDDQESIHDAYRSILTRIANKMNELEDLESLLFDSPVKGKDQPVSFEIESAYQGKDAFEMVRAAQLRGETYDMAFVDMRMPPGWDGVETIERLWQVDPYLQVVVCTAYFEHVWQDVCKRLRRTDQMLLLQKPFASDCVLSLAHVMTAKRKAINELKQNIAASYA